MDTLVGRSFDFVYFILFVLAKLVRMPFSFIIDFYATNSRSIQYLPHSDHIYLAKMMMVWF